MNLGRRKEKKSACVLLVILLQLFVKGIPMRIRENKTMKHRLATTVFRPMGLRFFFLLLQFKPLRSLKPLQRKRKIHADPLPLFITYLCRGIFHRMAKKLFDLWTSAEHWTIVSSGTYLISPWSFFHILPEPHVFVIKSNDLNRKCPHVTTPFFFFLLLSHFLCLLYS